MNRQREQVKKGTYVKFALILLCCALLGAGASIVVMDHFDALLQAGDLVNAWLPTLGVAMFAAGFVFCAVGTWLCARGSALVARAQEDDAAFEEADRLLCITTILSSAGFPWGIVAMGVAGPVLSTAASGSFLLGAFAVQLVWIMALQAKAVGAVKRLMPEKRGNVFDVNFRKDWYASCDEAEKQRIAECSYFTFRVMNGVYAAAAILIFMGTAAGFFQPLVMLLVGALWLTHIMSYLCRAYQMDHGKKRR